MIVDYKRFSGNYKIEYFDARIEHFMIQLEHSCEAFKKSSTSG